MTDRRLAELEITYDEDGNRRPGFQVGKAAAMLEWQHKQEKREFGKLVNRLRVRKWQMEVTAEDGPRLKKKRMRSLKWCKQNRESANAAARVRRRRNHVPRTYKCEFCHKVGVIPFRPGGGPRRFCNENCRQKAAYRKKRGSRRMHTCATCGEAGHNRRTCPSK